MTSPTADTRSEPRKLRATAKLQELVSQLQFQLWGNTDARGAPVRLGTRDLVLNGSVKLVGTYSRGRLCLSRPLVAHRQWEDLKIQQLRAPPTSSPRASSTSPLLLAAEAAQDQEARAIRKAQVAVSRRVWSNHPRSRAFRVATCACVSPTPVLL